MNFKGIEIKETPSAVLEKMIVGLDLGALDYTTYSLIRFDDEVGLVVTPIAEREFYKVMPSEEEI